MSQCRSQLSFPGSLFLPRTFTEQQGAGALWEQMQHTFPSLCPSLPTPFLPPFFPPSWLHLPTFLSHPLFSSFLFFSSLLPTPFLSPLSSFPPSLSLLSSLPPNLTLICLLRTVYGQTLFYWQPHRNRQNCILHFADDKPKPQRAKIWAEANLPTACDVEAWWLLGRCKTGSC